jgi:hypothetical protein
MKLKELQICNSNSGSQSHCNTIASCHGRVRGNSKKLPRSAGCKQDIPCPDLLHVPIGIDGLYANAATILDHQVKGKGVLMQDCCCAPNCCNECPLNLCASSSTTGMHHSGN